MKKPFKIECKIGSERSWGTWARYKTERAMRQAINTLSGGSKWSFIEFRCAPKDKT